MAVKGVIDIVSLHSDKMKMAFDSPAVVAKGMMLDMMSKMIRCLQLGYRFVEGL